MSRLLAPLAVFAAVRALAHATRIGCNAGGRPAFTAGRLAFAAVICAFAAVTVALASRVARNMRMWPTSCVRVQSAPGPVPPGAPTAVIAFWSKASW